MRKYLWIGLAVVALITIAAAAVWLLPPAASLVEGDAWDYGLTMEELPDGWTFDAHSVQLPHNLAVAQTQGDDRALLNNVRQIYSARYLPPPTSGYAELTLEVLIYNAVAEAQAALQAESPGENWGRAGGPTVGEQSVIWRYLDPTAPATQNLYRVDFRHLNAIGSVTLFGEAQTVPNADEVVGYARRVLARMQATPVPPALQRLQSRQIPDPRPLLLMSELPRLDPDWGDRWEVNARYLGSWTDNEDFEPEGRAVLERLGRLTGYQLYLLKPLSEEEQAQTPGAAYAVFQQISVYGSAENAPRGLDSMAGLPTATESTEPPPVGDRARLWSTLLRRSGTPDTIALTEINFVVGRFVATMQVQTTKLPSTVDREAILSANQERAITWAQALAQKLRTVQP